jgi:hypothetical protein
MTTLIVPAPVLAGGGPAGDGRWRSALIALIALGWVTAARAIAGRARLLALAVVALVATPAAASPAPAGRRIAASTKMALQMAAALGAAFAVGRVL